MIPHRGWQTEQEQGHSVSHGRLAFPRSMRIMNGLQMEYLTASKAGRSMIEIYADPGKPYLVLKASGLIRAEDYESRMPEFVKLVAESRPKGLLCDWTDLKGLDAEAESLRFFVRIQIRSIVRRAAILADRAWDAEVQRLDELVDFQVRRFAPSDRRSAQAWLESA